MVGISEMSRRQGCFEVGVPVTLADGQAWHFRRPAVVIAPRIEAGRVAGVVIGLEGVSDYDGLSAILRGDCGCTGEEAWQARFQVAVVMLRANYALSDSELAELLRVRPGDDIDSERSDTIADVFLGRADGPKAGPVTSS